MGGFEINMKIVFRLSLCIAAALLSGCASFHHGLVLDTVGPAPGAGVARQGQGTLVVYSANKVNADFNSRDPNRPEYSDYRILGNDGKMLKWVHNITDDIFQGPVAVKLSAGKYFVVARSNGYGLVTVPVVVAGNQNTVVRLDGRRDESMADKAEAVCLPDGEIVGWKAAASF